MAACSSPTAPRGQRHIGWRVAKRANAERVREASRRVGSQYQDRAAPDGFTQAKRSGKGGLAHPANADAEHQPAIVSES